MKENELLETIRRIVREETERSIEAYSQRLLEQELKNFREQTRRIFLEETGELLAKETAPLMDRLLNLEVLIENTLPRNIRLLAEGHAHMMEKLERLEELDALGDRVRTLEGLVSTHTHEISALQNID